MDKNSLSHTTWNCKYHIVFAPKYRRRIIYGKIKSEIGKILRMLCERKGGRDHRSRGASRPYTHAGEHTAEIQRIRVYGVLEREEFTHDI